MKKQFNRLAAALATLSILSSCATTYDAQGRPQQTLTPEGAVLGAAAVGLIGYSLAKDSKRSRKHYRRDRGHHRYHDQGYGGYRYNRPHHSGHYYGDDCGY